MLKQRARRCEQDAPALATGRAPSQPARTEPPPAADNAHRGTSSAWARGWHSAPPALLPTEMLGTRTAQRASPRQRPHSCGSPGARPRATQRGLQGREHQPCPRRAGAALTVQQPCLSVLSRTSTTAKVYWRWLEKFVSGISIKDLSHRNNEVAENLSCSRKVSLVKNFY